ncbi:MAG TPA: hypothetical protein VF574_06120 [Allosphingosinicella sp.]|jgi:hypothetical protein
MKYDPFDRQKRWIFPSKATPGNVDPADYEEYGYEPDEPEEAPRLAAHLSI